LAGERNINYQPSPEILSAVGGYCDRKGISCPPGFGGGVVAPQYIPQGNAPAPMNFDMGGPGQPPPGGYGGPPAGGPPGGFGGPGNNPVQY